MTDDLWPLAAAHTDLRLHHARPHDAKPVCRTRARASLNRDALRVTVRPCLLRRLGIIRSPFATLGETLRAYREPRHRGRR